MLHTRGDLGYLMAVSMLVKTYSQRTSLKLRGMLERESAGTWLADKIDSLFQICDELVKNSVKANYKFLLTWLGVRKRLMQDNPEFQKSDADEWLAAVFFSGEEVLLEKNLAKLENRDSISGSVRRILDLENELLKHRRRAGPSETYRDMFRRFVPLFKMKRLARKLDIGLRVRVDRSPDQLVITVENDAPILEVDVERIRNVRTLYQEYAARGEPQMFFVDNLDTSGGGHGLGYALMDSVLSDMGINSEEALFLVPGGKTMVLLTLPTDPPTSGATRGDDAQARTPPVL